MGYRDTMGPQMQYQPMHTHATAVTHTHKDIQENRIICIRKVGIVIIALNQLSNILIDMIVTLIYHILYKLSFETRDIDGYSHVIDPIIVLDRGA